MTAPPVEVVAAAYGWCRQWDYDPGDTYEAIFVPKDHEFNTSDETRDLWHIFFYPDAMKRFATTFFVVVVDPATLEAEGH